MEAKPLTSTISQARLVTATLATVFFLSISLAIADTYRWKDKDGKVHYGASVPAEYADQPYDVLNSAGLVIEHVEDTSISLEVIEEKKTLDRQPLISDEERQRQSDRLLVIQYSSVEDIKKALELEVAQLSYDKNIIDQSYESTNKAIRAQVRQAADQQRAELPIGADQQKEIDKLYARRSRDEEKKQVMKDREERIRNRYQVDIERYLLLTSESQETNDDQADKG